jgi:murein DD-endopeptidase MepM/ murein hydrolase activator NlpD
MLEIAFPLEGIYITPNTPGSKIPSHGTAMFGEEYAIDFVMIQENGKWKKPYKRSFFEYLFKGLDLNNFYGWGQKVYSPIIGEVVEIENIIEERNPVNIFKDYKNTIKVTKQYIKNGESSKIITGNYVMIKYAENVYVLLAHLKKNSIKVRVGQKVQEHEEIGELGHSGNSTMPHLHMQFMDNRDYKAAKGIPFVIKEYEIKKGENWISVKNGVPKIEDIIRYKVE